MSLRIASLWVAALFALGVAIQPCRAAGELSSVTRFDIPAGPLPDALLQFSAQSEVQVTSVAELVGQKHSQGVTGELPSSKALTLLLVGTHLSYDAVDSHTVSIRLESRAAAGETSANGQASYVHGGSTSPISPTNPDGEQGRSAVATDKREITLEEVVVTARRREERAQSVPASITAYTAQDVKSHNITDQLSLANSTPSMVSISSGQPAETGGFAIRGQGPAFGATPGTIGYFSEVPNGLIAIDGRPGTYYDLASVQVLKGPQGTLFGKNATGGNVLFEPQRPTDQFGGYVQVQAGDYRDRELEGALNLPVFKDDVLLRVSGAYARRDGYTHDVGPLYPGKDYDNLGYESFRAELILRPLDVLENYTIYRYYHSNDHGPGTSLIAFNPDAGQAPFTISQFFPDTLTNLSQQLARGPRKVAFNIDEYDQSDYRQLINTTTYMRSDSFEVKNIFSYSHAQYSYGYDYDASVDPIAGQTSRGTQTEAETYTSEELQVQGRLFGDALQYVIGGFLDRQWPKQLSVGEFDYFPASVLLGEPVHFEQYIGTRSRAAFTQLTYDLGKLLPVVDGLSLTAGYRYTHDELYQGTLTIAPPFVSGAGKWNYGSYTFGLDYKITPTVLTYVTTRSAFKAGGINSELPAGSAFATFEPEKLQDVEVGLKADFHVNDMAIRTNIDFFRGNYSDIQRTTPVVSNGILVNLTNNAAKGLIEGVEWEGTLLPIPSVELSTLYAYTESKYTAVNGAQAELVLQGAPFPYVSKNKGSVSARYRLPLDPAAGDLGIMGIYVYQSPQSIAQTNATVYPYMPGYGLVNARLDWRGAFRSPVDISAFVTNLTNKTYPIGQFDAYASFGFVTRTYGPPRMYGVQAKYSFGQ